MDNFEQLRSRIDQSMQRDRFRLRGDLRRLSKRGTNDPKLAETFQQRLEESNATFSRRKENAPQPVYDTTLPIYQRKDEICDAIRNNRVVVISGETGSGKSTQLPLMALECGYGISGVIGHTQPRRIAARGVASRVATQVKGQGKPGQGKPVAYKIRFADQTGEDTFIKLMTDGILLAETRSDRFLDQYDLIIVDEAHERSLNIDFLLGCLYRILLKRPQLRLVITSATIDTEKFADHFSGVQSTPVPIINVEGRTFPVEIRYRPMDSEPGGNAASRELEQAVVDSCHEIAAEEAGDILVFLPTENDIRGLSKKLRGINLPGGRTEVLPLYARLSTEQQNRIFQPHKSRHIILATNVAESSITVPGIRAVIDAGTARISRYAPRSKVQRLPIEPVSRASANQRSGRCGRVGPGICIRLFSEEDFLVRPEFTTPEIRRTNLASVILQTLALKLGDIAEFPFIDPPQTVNVRDGYKTLFEIGAVDDHRRLTSQGRKLARLPVDPRIGKMVFQAEEEGCLAEILIIASALEIQDPRQRPAGKQPQADAAHEKFKHETSDFLSMLTIWDFFDGLKQKLSRAKLKLACTENFLSYPMMRQWQDTHRQLKQMAADSGLRPRTRKDDYDSIHRSLLAGLLSGVAHLDGKHEYTGAGGIKFHLWPGSGVFSAKPKWIIAGEVVETSRRYGRNVASIQVSWIEKLAAHLVKKHYSDPHWSRKQQTIMATERVTLFGLPVVAGRRSGYAKIDPPLARRLFIEQALVSEEEELQGSFDFYTHNMLLLEQIKSDAAKTRDRRLIIDRFLLARFYESRLPEQATDPATLKRMIKSDRSIDQQLTMTRADLLEDTEDTSGEQFPDNVKIGSMNVPVRYAFEPGTGSDGATVELPVEGVSQIDDTQAGWLIPGMMESRVVAMIRSLPKAIRRNFVPAPATAEKVVEQLEFGVGSFNVAVAEQLSRIAAQPVDARLFEDAAIDPHLRINIRVVDPDGTTVAEGRTMAELRTQLGSALAGNVVEVEDQTWNQDGLKEWPADDLPADVMIQRGQTSLKAFPAMIDQQDSVGIRLADSRAAADQLSRQGLVRLFSIANRKSVRSQVSHLPDLNRHAISVAKYIPSAELRRQLGDLIIRIAFVDLQKVVRNREQFEERQTSGIEKIAIASQEVSRWLPKWTAAVHQAELQLQSMPDRFGSAKGDIREQLKALAPENFLATTPWRWLEQYPRFFEAVKVRIEKLPTLTPPKEKELRESVAQYCDMYQVQCSRHADHAIVDPELETFRWMIEELRVSLFAQQLGTSITVSDKRMEKQWKKVRQV